MVLVAVGILAIEVGLRHGSFGGCGGVRRIWVLVGMVIDAVVGTRVVLGNDTVVAEEEISAGLAV